MYFLNIAGLGWFITVGLTGFPFGFGFGFGFDFFGFFLVSIKFIHMMMSRRISRNLIAVLTNTEPPHTSALFL